MYHTHRSNQPYQSEIYLTGGSRPWLVLSCVFILDWFFPLMLRPFYDGYNPLLDSLTKFGYNEAPTYWAYRIYLICYALVIFYGALDGYGYLREAGPRLAQLVVTGLVVFALFPGFLAGIFPYNLMGKEEIARSLHWWAILLGYWGLFFSCIGLIVLLWRTGRHREAIAAIIAESITLVAWCLLLTNALGVPGLWERVINDVIYVPFIIFGLLRWRRDRDTMVPDKPEPVVIELTRVPVRPRPRRTEVVIVDTTAPDFQPLEASPTPAAPVQATDGRKQRARMLIPR